VTDDVILKLYIRKFVLKSKMYSFLLGVRYINLSMGYNQIIIKMHCDGFAISNRFPCKDVQGIGVDSISLLVEYSRQINSKQLYSLHIKKFGMQQSFSKIYV